MESSNNRTTTTIIILIATALLIGGVVFVSQQNKPKDNTAKTSIAKTNTTSKKQTLASQQTASTSYKEGTYSATGNYQSPGGSQEIKVSIKLASDGTINDTSAEGDGKSSNSQFYQSSFISNYKDKVVGKKIDDVSLSHVGASSLTSDGFNNALEDIKNQAKA